MTWAYGPPRRNGRREKVPHVARTRKLASVVNPADWCEFDVAREAVKNDATLDGIGYVFVVGDKMIGVDLDNCRNPDTGELKVGAAQLIADLNTYTEVSPSLTGVKAFAMGELDPDGWKRRCGVEVYESRRYFTVTGFHVPRTPTEVRSAGDVVRRLRESLSPELPPRPAGTEAGFTGSDDELLRRAQAAKNGAKVAAYLAGDLCGKPSLSESLLGLAQLLAFWTGRDLDRLERLVCSSQLYQKAESERMKWRSRRGSDSWGMKYVVRKAIETCREFYSGSILVDTLTPQKTHTCVSSDRQLAFVGQVFEEVRNAPLPPVIMASIESRQPALLAQQQRLAALCRALDQKNGGGFFLSSLDAQRLLGVDQTTVSRWLRKFRTLKLIRRTKRGNGIGGLANCYVWTGENQCQRQPDSHQRRQSRGGTVSSRRIAVRCA